MALLEAGQRVARYEVLGRIATGGMSEVYLARQSGPSGFSKTLVLKVILPTLAHDPQFVQMFHNEAKLAAMLNHSNVVQIFDFGVDDEIHYMTMEYIDGRNLGHLTQAVEARKQRVPIPIALRIIGDACAALQYAHSLTDADGQTLDLIHRDVSLENVLLTYSGQIKLVDFGVAKARNLESYTQTGTLKGKYNYMAPEMIEGKKLDSRADIFSMGVVLYKLLVGRLPFIGQNHAQLLHRIAFDDPPPPRSLSPDFPPALEPLLLKSLARDRDQRYSRVGDLQQDIERYMAQAGHAVMPYHLSTFMTDLFPAGSDPTREQYRQLVSSMSVPPAAVRIQATGPGTPTQLPHAIAPRPVASAELPDFEDGLENERTQEYNSARHLMPQTGYPPAAATAISPTFEKPTFEKPTFEQPTFEKPTFEGPTFEKPRRSRRLLLPLVAIALGTFLLAGTLVYLIVADSTDPLRIDSGMTVAILGGDAEPRAPRLDSGPSDLKAPDLSQRVDAAAPPVDLARRPKTPASLRGRLSVGALGQAVVYIDGRRIGPTPLESRWLSAGRHRLEVRGQNPRYTLRRSVLISANTTQRLVMKPRKGRLRIRVEPWAKVWLDGRLVGTTPFPPIAVWQGKHHLKLKNAGLKISKSMTVWVKADQAKVVKVRLR